MREIEAGLHLWETPPEAGLRRSLEATCDRHAAHPDRSRLMSIADIHDAEPIAGSVPVAARDTPSWPTR